MLLIFNEKIKIVICFLAKIKFRRFEHLSTFKKYVINSNVIIIMRPISYSCIVAVCPEQRVKLRQSVPLNRTLVTPLFVLTQRTLVRNIS